MYKLSNLILKSRIIRICMSYFSEILIQISKNVHSTITLKCKNCFYCFLSVNTRKFLLRLKKATFNTKDNSLTKFQTVSSNLITNIIFQSIKILN